MTAFRYAVTIEYVGVFELDNDEDYDEGDLGDTAVDWALDGGYRDRTVVDVEVSELKAV